MKIFDIISLASEKKNPKLDRPTVPSYGCSGYDWAITGRGSGLANSQ